MQLQYGFIFPGGDPRTLAELSHEAEAAGWDGVFVPDCIDIDNGNATMPAGFDPWVMLAAMAMRTERVRLGAIVTLTCYPKCDQPLCETSVCQTV